MGLSSVLIQEFVKTTKDTNERVTDTTVYGTIVDFNNSQWVRLDGSELLTPFTTTTNVKAGERVLVRIKDHTATVTGNLSSPAARTEEVADVNVSVQELDGTISELGIVVADKVNTTYLEANYATIESLNIVNARIDNLDLNYLSAAEADIKYATIESLNATNATISKLDSTYAKIEILESTYATIENLNATNLKVNNLEAAYGDFVRLTTDNFEAINAKINNLDADYLTVKDADIKYATIESLNATNANVGNLTTDIADINTLIFGSASGDTIHANFANAVIAQLGNAQIKSAMIESVSADKITAGDIITNNVRVLSEDGSLVISDETIQISDENRIRVQIGKDAANDYSINIWDADGKLMFSEGGLTADGVKESIIRNDMVSETANIAASKLDIDSLFTEINGSSQTIKSSKIYFDDRNQTLDVAFTSMTTSVNGLSNTVSSQGTQISTIQGQISSKIWQQDITSATTPLNETINGLTTQYSALDLTINGISATVASHTTLINQKASSSDVSSLGSRMSTVEQTASGLTVSLQTTNNNVAKVQNDVDNLSVGGRNLIAGTSKDTVYTGNKGSASYKDVWSAKTIDIPTGTEYVVSFDAKADVAQEIVCHFYSPNTTTSCKSSTGQSSSSADGRCGVNITTSWKRYWVKWTQTPADAVKNIIVGRNSTANNIHIRAVKLEEGNSPTAWTPAPEDVSGSISTAQTTANNAASAASTAQSTANTARTEAANAAKTATNYLNFSSSGLVIGDMTASTLGKNVLIDSDSVDIRNGSSTIASFGANLIELGKGNYSATIDLINGVGRIWAERSDDTGFFDRLYIDSNNLYLKGGDVRLDTSTQHDNPSQSYSDSASAMITAYSYKGESSSYASAGLSSKYVKTKTVARIDTHAAAVDDTYISLQLDDGNQVNELLITYAGLNFTGPYAQLRSRNTNTPLYLYPSSGNTSVYTVFCNNAGSELGRLGFNAVDTPVAFVGGGDKILLHAGNWSNYCMSNKPTNIELNSTGALANYGGFIDFHFNGSTADYTSRIIEQSSGVLTITGGLDVKGTLRTTGVLYADGDVVLTNGGVIRGKKADGTEMNLLQINANNYTMLGYDSYINKFGATYVDGNTVNIRSNGNVNVTGNMTVSGVVKIAAGQSFAATNSAGTVRPLIWLSTSDSINIGQLDNEPVNVYIRCQGDHVDLLKATNTAYSAHLQPGSDGKVTLGVAAKRWYAVYAANATVQTSDGREKENILPLNDEIHSRMFDSLKPVQFNFITGSGRTCYGLIAQEVLETMDELGIGEHELDLVQHDTWIDEDTNEVKDTFGIAYSNLIAMLIYEVQKLKKEIAALKSA